MRATGTPAADLAVAAVYERRVAASLERVWENVLDWEHLPWLHARAFSRVERLEAGDWGWRARLGGAGGGAPSEVELRVDREAGRYVVRTGAAAAVGASTNDGSGMRSEIWTSLQPESPEATHVRVEFRVPPMPREQLEAVGRAYVAVYTGLWDEDEEMMVERSERLRELAAPGPPAPVDLGPVEALRERLPLDVSFGGRPHRIALIDGRLVAHSAVCPHMLGPLFAVDGEPATLECPWHGYAYDARSGRSCDGRGLRLSPAPQVVVDERTGRCTLEPA